MNLPPQVLAALGGQPLSQVVTEFKGGRLVPNVHPTLPADYKLQVVNF
jgi:hypothetical protein